MVIFSFHLPSTSLGGRSVTWTVPAAYAAAGAATTSAAKRTAARKRANASSRDRRPGSYRVSRRDATVASVRGVRASSGLHHVAASQMLTPIHRVPLTLVVRGRGMGPSARPYGPPRDSLARGEGARAPSPWVKTRRAPLPRDQGNHSSLSATGL